MMATTETEAPLKLYELTAGYKDIEAILQENATADEPDEERARALEQALGSITDAIQDKVDGIGAVLANLEGRAAVCDAQADSFAREVTRLRERGQAFRNEGEGLRFYLQRELATMGENTVKAQGRNFTASLSKVPAPKARVVSEAVLPARFKRAVLWMPQEKVTSDLIDYQHGEMALREEAAKAQEEWLERLSRVPPLTVTLSEAVPGVEMVVADRRLKVY